MARPSGAEPSSRLNAPGLPNLRARVHVALKDGVLDPQGEAIRGALAGLGFAGVIGARQGKVIELDLAERDAARARKAVEAMCRQLLANTVIERFAIDIEKAARKVMGKAKASKPRASKRKATKVKGKKAKGTRSR